MASTTRLCQPFKEFHYQANPGQSFPLEVATGHVHHSYLVILHESDFNKLNGWTPGPCISKDENCVAPGLANDIRLSFSNPSANKHLEVGRRRYHRGLDPGCPSGDEPDCKPDLAPGSYSIANSLQAPAVPKDDPNYVIRPQFFTDNRTPPGNRFIDNEGLMFQYQDHRASADTIFEATDGSFVGYEWVEAYYEFFGTGHHPYHADGVMVNVPATKGPGHYIIFYNFGGYYDCIDVNVVSQFVADPSGSAADIPTYKYNRVDHCAYTEAVWTGTCHVVTDSVDSLQPCIDECNAMSPADCTGVNVAPLNTPSTALFPAQSHAPLGQPNCVVTGAPADARICYPVKERAVSGNGDTPYQVSADPGDSVFYGTCFTRDVDNGFEEAGDSAVAPPWYWNGRCMGCDQWTANQAKTAIPRWDILDGDCFECTNSASDSMMAQEPEVCPAPTETLANHYIANSANVFPGTANELTGTIADCHAKCCATPSCVAFVRDDEESKCWFKTATCPADLRLSSAGPYTVFLPGRSALDCSAGLA